MSYGPNNAGECLPRLQAHLQQTQHRALIFISGDNAWTISCVQSMLDQYRLAQTLWVGLFDGVSGRVITNTQVHHVLGEEYDAVVYDAHQSFDANAFAAVTGTLKGGGICYLLTPALSVWPTFQDPVYKRLLVSQTDESVNSEFIRRFLRIATTDIGVFFIDQKNSALSEENVDELIDHANTSQYSHEHSEQQAAVSAIHAMMQGHRRRPLVITADRGRGKSSALGMAAAEMLGQGVKRIIVTAPRLEAVASLFKHAQLLMPQADFSPAKLLTVDASIEFVPPDVLLASDINADCVMVDEAAALPNAMLEKLLKKYSRLVFATTVHGYEGTGRGFALRFFKLLDKQTPGWKHLVLKQAIRWANDDPLEQFIFRALLLNSDMRDVDDGLQPLDINQCELKLMTPAQLVEDEAILKQVFGLLVLAHYRTRPNDLRQMLDSQAMTIFVAVQDETVLGVCLVLNESSLAERLQQEIYLGKRRLHGHLLAQTLLAHLGVTTVGDLRFSRIMRIAVHPQYQGEGLGTRLLNEVTEYMRRQEDCDVLGASFGMTLPLHSFWQRADFDVVRLGLTREQTSGCHGGVVLQALSQRAKPCLAEAKKRFVESWPFLLTTSLQTLDVDLVIRLSRQEQKNEEVRLSESDRRELHALAYAQRGVDMSRAVLDKLVWQVLRQTSLAFALPYEQRMALIAVAIQNQSWEQVVNTLTLKGKREAIALLRSAVSTLITKLDGLQCKM